MPQLMPGSVQPPASRSTSIVRPDRAEPAYRRRVADATAQPEGAAGCAKRTAARRLFTGPLDMTLSTESLPLLSDVDAWSNQASATAVRLRGEPQSAATPSIVQVRFAGESSTLPAVSVARTSKRCSPEPRPSTCCGDVQAANAAPSSEHANVDPGSFEENSNVAEPTLVVPDGPASMDVSGRGEVRVRSVRTERRARARGSTTSCPRFRSGRAARSGPSGPRTRPRRTARSRRRSPPASRSRRPSRPGPGTPGGSRRRSRNRAPAGRTTAATRGRRGTSGRWPGPCRSSSASPDCRRGRSTRRPTGEAVALQPVRGSGPPGSGGTPPAVNVSQLRFAMPPAAVSGGGPRKTTYRLWMPLAPEIGAVRVVHEPQPPVFDDLDAPDQRAGRAPEPQLDVPPGRSRRERRRSSRRRRSAPGSRRGSRRPLRSRRFARSPSRRCRARSRCPTARRSSPPRAWRPRCAAAAGPGSRSRTESRRCGRRRSRRRPRTRSSSR